MKSLQKVLMILCIMGLFSACGGGSSDTPESVAVESVKSLYKGDMDGMKKLMAKEELAELEENEEMTKQFFAAIREECKGITDFKAVETTLSDDGNSATVKVEVKGGETTKIEKVDVIKEDGKWVFKSMSLK